MYECERMKSSSRKEIKVKRKIDLEFPLRNQEVLRRKYTLKDMMERTESLEKKEKWRSYLVEFIKEESLNMHRQNIMVEWEIIMYVVWRPFF